MTLLDLAIEMDLDAQVGDTPGGTEAPPKPVVSFVISTYNRRDVLLKTLARLEEVGVAHEVCVVDNASADRTADAVAVRFPEVRLIALHDNRGSCAKNLGVSQSYGQYVVFLDDDSFPEPGAIEGMIRQFESDPKLGAAVFTVTLPDGSRECSAYPDVFIGCGVGFRAAALRQVGLLPTDFFMQAEEYDLSLRLLDAGWSVRTFDDLHVTHLKTPGARFSARVTRLDVRNNLVLIARHFPARWAVQFARDWMRRYWHIAAGKSHRLAFVRGLAEGLARIACGVGRKPVSDAAFEQFAKVETIRRGFEALCATHCVRRVLFVDYGKNILPYWLAAQSLGVQVVAIADPRLVHAKRYRGIPIVDDEQARHLDFDAVVVSNSSPVHARQRIAKWRLITEKPVTNFLIG